jgi:branched-chain amino acid transport system ATP-binding protein
MSRGGFCAVHPFGHRREEYCVLSLLVVSGLCVSYGEVRALSDASLYVNDGEVVALLGPNGAGKSSALRAIAGFVRPTAGTVAFRGKNVTGTPPHVLVRAGLVLAPEERHVFGSMSVSENLALGGYTLRSRSLVRQRVDYVLGLFPSLLALSERRAATLSGGEQQLLAMGRALVLQPALLLLDEPSFALSPNYVRIVFDKIRALVAEQTSVLLVEQNAAIALETSDRAYLFEVGRICAEGASNTLLGTPEVQALYLGTGGVAGPTSGESASHVEAGAPGPEPDR